MCLSMIKRTINIGAPIRPLYLDIFCIFLLIGLNPITYFFPLSPGFFSPDVLSYAALAKDLFSKGLLYIPSWGHIDTGLILPPLFPFLIACGTIFSQETLAIAELVSSICMLIFIILIFFYIRKMTNRIVALISICLIQINYYYFFIGMTPLSESVFLLTLSLTLWLGSLFFSNPCKRHNILSFLLGISCSLVFLSRQIGIIIYVFVGISFILQYLLISGNERRVLVKNYFIVICGVLTLLIPYILALYLQTGQHPLTQDFRKNEYLIKVSDPGILQEIEREKVLPTELMEFFETQSDKDYAILYTERRRMRKLLPDASEMYAYVEVADNTKIGERIELVLSNFREPGIYFSKIYNNILHLIPALGSFTTGLFFILFIFSIIIQKNKKDDINSFLLPSFIIFYLLIITLLTDKIARYIYIIFPFCLIYVSIESYKHLIRAKYRFKIKLPVTLIFFFLSILILLTTPRFFTELNLTAKYLNSNDKDCNSFKRVINGLPVFSLSPFEVFKIGGKYRILPNDSLQKVVKYGEKTNVKWLLISRTQSSVSQLRLYGNVNWYFINSLEKTYPDLVKFRLSSTDGVLVLYEIL